jgi:hypothetical protein
MPNIRGDGSRESWVPGDEFLETTREFQVVHRILMLGSIHSLPAVLPPNTLSSG